LYEVHGIEFEEGERVTAALPIPGAAFSPARARTVHTSVHTTPQKKGD